MDDVTHLVLAFLERAYDLVVLRKPTCFVLGEDQIVVHDDVERPDTSWQDFWLDSELLLDCGRQTGGLRSVVSLHAVTDRDFQGYPFLELDSARPTSDLGRRFST